MTLEEASGTSKMENKGDRSLNALSTQLWENFKAFYTPKESGTQGT